MGVGRGQLSAFELLPAEAGDIVDWAGRELAARKRTQTDIYGEFVSRCEALMAEHRGELEFRIPAFGSFNRMSLRQARLSRRLSETQDIVRVLAPMHDAKTSDELTVLLGETIKSAIYVMLGDRDDELEAKDLKVLAEAARHAQAAQNMSSERKARETVRTAAKVTEAVEAVAKARGLTAETAEAIKAQILGVVVPRGG